ncbi:MAG: hypothetical protein KatS3mg087_0897 [Patescibacteria group bacterium]|nr:MAG: hypothetical protein KatS3mg087_0897 [Patescibacteria group bacterium]
MLGVQDWSRLFFSSLTTIIGLVPITLSNPLWQGLGWGDHCGISFFRNDNAVFDSGNLLHVVCGREIAFVKSERKPGDVLGVIILGIFPIGLIFLID